MAVTIAAFRRWASRLPGATEGEHMGHPDFRAGGKIFASLGEPDESWGMVKLTPEQQHHLMHMESAFTPAPGVWGRRGYTRVRLARADSETLKCVMIMAWLNTGPRSTSGRRRR